MHQDTVVIDGSYGEGGGQILRSSLCLSALLGRGLVVRDIRKGRSRPGLAAQHVTCVRAAAEICGAQVAGDEIGSMELGFQPGPVRPGSYSFDVADVRPSAGSATLVLQTVLLPLLLCDAPSEVRVRGGTNVPWSPSFEYLRDVFLPAISRTGARVSIDRLRGGWYPRGGGEIVARIEPVAANLHALDLADRGEMKRLNVTSTVSRELPDHVVKRQAAAALQPLPHDISRLAKRVAEHPEGGPGTCLTLAAEFDAGHGGASALGERGKRAEQVGSEAAHEFLEFLNSGAAVDRHLADQLLLFAALAEGTSHIHAEVITEHLRTNAWVIQQFLKVQIDLLGAAPVLVTVQGAGQRSEWRPENA